MPQTWKEGQGRYLGQKYPYLSPTYPGSVPPRAFGWPQGQFGCLCRLSGYKTRHLVGVGGTLALGLCCCCGMRKDWRLWPPAMLGDGDRTRQPGPKSLAEPARPVACFACDRPEMNTGYYPRSSLCSMHLGGTTRSTEERGGNSKGTDGSRH